MHHKNIVECMEIRDLSHVNIAQIEQYVKKQSTDSASADKAVDEFLANYTTWKEIVGYMLAGREDGDNLYGAALCTFSGNLYYSTRLSARTVEVLRGEIEGYDDAANYRYPYKDFLYSNLVACLHKGGFASDDELKDLLKKAIYYTIAQTNNTSYQGIDCYAYRSVHDYMLDSFKNETLSMSSPTTFNDPFDCPILEILNQYGDELSKLMREAYQDCLKITCFVKNRKLEPVMNEEGIPVRVPKHENDPDEYLSELMWAHYAKNHTGMCVKYHFRNDITKFADKSKGQIAYFRDVKYTSELYTDAESGTINLRDAFFVKSKAWEYENELRLLAYDPKGNGDYASIDAKNSVAAVYFGLKCPKDKRSEIMAILKDRKWVSERSVWNTTTHKSEDIIEEHPVEFFQMEIDKEHFGKLKAVKIGCK